MILLEPRMLRSAYVHNHLITGTQRPRGNALRRGHGNNFTTVRTLFWAGDEIHVLHDMFEVACNSCECGSCDLC